MIDDEKCEHGFPIDSCDPCAQAFQDELAESYDDRDMRPLRVVIYKRRRERAHLKAWRATHGPEYDFSNAPALNGLR